MKKIRIGNDVRLAVDLRQYLGPTPLKEREVYNPADPQFEGMDTNPYVNKVTEVYWPNQYTNQSESSLKFEPTGSPISIRSINVFIINTSKLEERKKIKQNKFHFVSRFPIEPYVNVLESTPYDICEEGRPRWHTYPYPHRIVPYGGFGVHPCWDGIYKHLPENDDLKYHAQVFATMRQNVVEVSFPAEAQKYTGVYKVVIVAKIYAPGFGPHNLKTITVDVPDVFELTSDSTEGSDTGINATVQNVVDVLATEEDVNYSGDNYVKTAGYNSGILTLGRSDGQDLHIDMNADDWYNGD